MSAGGESGKRRRRRANPTSTAPEAATETQTAAGAPDLSIVVPAYNEAPGLQPRLQTLYDLLRGEPYSADVIIVDDGSDDETAEVVESFAAEHAAFSLLRNPHRGKAYAVATGIMSAAGRNALFMDMDLATSLRHTGEFLRALESGSADVVIASRKKRGAVRRGTPLSRRAMSKAFNLLVQALLLPGLSDTQCGFKAFRRDVARDLFSNMRVFVDEQPVSGPLSTAFDVELLVMARRRGYRIKELPVRWRHVASRRVSALRDPHRMLLQVLRVWLNERRGLYGGRR